MQHDQLKNDPESYPFLIGNKQQSVRMLRYGRFAVAEGDTGLFEMVRQDNPRGTMLTIFLF